MSKKITLKGNVKIIDYEYVIKKKTNGIKDIYEYLESRGFSNFPRIIKINDKEIIYEYISDLLEPREQKINDLILLISMLHNKTTFYKEIDLEHYKYIYEEINHEIDDTYKYYNNLMDIIDNEVFMSPADYLIARNISMVYKTLNYAKEKINLWYKMVDGKRQARVVMIHNNLRLEHYLKSDKPYLISFDKSRIDLPVFDLAILYKNHYLEFDFTSLLDIYFDKYPYTEEEMMLFLVLIAIPSKIKEENSEYEQVRVVRLNIDYLYKTWDILEKYRIEEKTNKG